MLILLIDEQFQKRAYNQMAYVNNVKMFVRVYELGSMSAAARDQRTSPAVASSRISELEKHLGVRLFNRTTRALQPTENGTLFYKGAHEILDSITQAEAVLTNASASPRGTLLVAAPLGLGRQVIAPAILRFHADYPDIKIRLRQSDRKVDFTTEGLDLAFHLGALEDSDLKVRAVADCPRILCAAPEYVARHGVPKHGQELLDAGHACLNLRFPGAREFQWSLLTPDGPRRYAVSGPFESDDGDVLTHWALQGAGIVMKPVFEVADHLASGALVPVCQATPALPVALSCLLPTRKFRDAKVQVFADYMIDVCKRVLLSKGQA